MASKETPQRGNIKEDILDGFRELDPTEEFTRSELAERFGVKRETLYGVFDTHAFQFEEMGKKGQEKVYRVIEDAFFPPAAGSEKKLPPDHGGVTKGRFGA